MCCNNKPLLVREILEKFKLDDFLVGYKRYSFSHGILKSPYMNRVVPLPDLLKGVIESDSKRIKPCLRYVDIENGIHVYKRNPGDPGDPGNYISLAPWEFIIPVYGQVKDLLGVDDRDAVFKRIYIVTEDLIKQLEKF